MVFNAATFNNMSVISWLSNIFKFFDFHVLRFWA